MEKIRDNYTDFINGHDHEDVIVGMAIHDILQSGISSDTLKTFGVKLFNGTKEKLTENLNFNTLPIDFTKHKFIEFPYFNQKGKLLFYRYKILPPPAKDTITSNYFSANNRYLHPKNVPSIPYVLSKNIQNKTNIPVWITEGEKKGLKLFQHHRSVIAISGVWMFNSSEDADGIHPLKYELDTYKWKGRTVYLGFDNDVWTNHSSKLAVFELAFKLFQKRALVKIITWEGQKGIDDHLALLELSKNIQAERELDKLEHVSEELLKFMTPYNAIIEEIVRPIAKTNILGFQLDRLITTIKDNFNVTKKAVIEEIQSERERLKINEDEVTRSNLLLKELCKLDYLPEMPGKFMVNEGGLLLEIKSIQKIDIPEVKSRAFAIAAFVNGDRSKLLFRSTKNNERVFSLAMSDSREFDANFSDLLQQPLDTDSIKSLQKYIKVYYMANESNIPVIKGINKTGWNDSVFYLPTRVFDGMVWSDETDFLKEAISVKGKAKSQINTLKSILQTQAGACVLAGLSSPLLELVGIPNYILNLTGMMKRGKSTIASFNASLWGNPEFLKGSWFSTKVGFEIFSSMWKDMPTWLDDFESAGQKEQPKIIDFIYQYHQGFGKLRGTKTMKLQKVLRFRGVFVNTAEKDIDTIIGYIRGARTVPRGVLRRVIEITIDEDSYTKFDTEEKINIPNINITSLNNYGWFARAWVEFIENNTKLFIDEYNRQYEELVTAKAIEGIESSYAIILTTSIMLDKLLSIDSLLLREWIKDNIIQTHQQKMAMTEDIISEFITTTRDVISMNKDKFYGMQDDIKDVMKMRAEWGEVRDNGDIFLLGTIFRDEICGKYGFIKQQIIKELDKYNMLEKSDTDHQRYTKKYYLNGKQILGYYIKGVFSDKDKEKETEELF